MGGLHEGENEGEDEGEDADEDARNVAVLVRILINEVRIRTWNEMMIGCLTNDWIRVAEY